jgi:hypothetical protein
MHRCGWVSVVLGGLVITACGGSAPDGLFGPSSGGPPLGSSGGSDDGGASASGGTTLDAGNSNDSGSKAPPQADGGGGGGGGGGTDAGAPCYSEPYDPNATLADLASAYTPGSWLATSIEAMHRRYPTGHFVLQAEQSDPQLPQFVDASSWDALMASLMTVLDAETTGWDFANADAVKHSFVIIDTVHLTAPQLTTWARGEITQYIGDASTQTYDQMELQGQEGTYDAIFLFDALNSACNGLAAATAVGDQITWAIPARDSVAAHLYYMELYLRVGRTAHATAYAALKADPGWQKVVRYEWARAHFWDAQSKGNASLQNAAAPIWAHIVDPANLAEIQQFTGQSPDAVACHP